MDTSEQYIKMCKAAKEIQDLWQPSEGDWFYYEAGKTKCIGVIGDFVDIEKSIMRTWGADDSGYEDVDVLVGLPTIDQHIEMARMGWREFVAAVDKYKDSATLEIASTHFVMKKFYGKTWNGESWI